MKYEHGDLPTTKEEWKAWGDYASMRLLLDQHGFITISRKERACIRDMSKIWLVVFQPDIENAPDVPK